MLTGARPVGCQGTEKGRGVDLAKLDGHAASVDAPVALRRALSIGEPDNRRIAGTRAKQTSCELGRKVVANDEFRIDTAV